MFHRSSSELQRKPVLIFFIDFSRDVSGSVTDASPNPTGQPGPGRSRPAQANTASASGARSKRPAVFFGQKL